MTIRIYVIIKIWRQSTDGKVDDFCRDATVQRLDISDGGCYGKGTGRYPEAIALTSLARCQVRSRICYTGNHFPAVLDWRLCL
ncbi:MAG: hypothetical protein GDA56_17000 [Hormoscilla sp. GM7CHS1pb]|nr:hypothetical protein [Hormoscilla sp. GM7CHS1pb]MBC6479200.1 hypothetical protein [Hormoscilla sp. GM7CHS1pb]